MPEQVWTHATLYGGRLAMVTSLSHVVMRVTDPATAREVASLVLTTEEAQQWADELSTAIVLSVET